MLFLLLSVSLLIFAVFIDTSEAKKRVVVAGATGYIGRAVVRELVNRGIPTNSLVRSEHKIADITAGYLDGSNIISCDFFDRESLEKSVTDFQADAVICCLASRSGVARDSWLVDYQASANLLNAFSNSRESTAGHFVLLSAFCCGKPLLQFQYAKLKLEDEIRQSPVSHSIVRPTAYFKSVDGQIESVRKGNPVIYFGDGTCAANAICETDLAKFIVDCALRPKSTGMMNKTRNVGGPDVPPIPKRQQGEYIYDALEVPQEKRKFVSIPLTVLDLITNTFSLLESVFSTIKISGLQERCGDAAEITRIIKYYASEPMIAIGENEVQGETTLKQHFMRIANRGGVLEEVDKMTTTAGILEAFAKKEYLNAQPKATAKSRIG